MKSITTPTEATAIVAYCRVYTEEQKLHGLGLEAQFAAIEEYAARAGVPVVAHSHEAATRRKDALKNRPELTNALAHARRSGATLIFARWGRLSRNTSCDVVDAKHTALLFDNLIVPRVPLRSSP
jgi:DNA invertase Pin-like site-specific DNA recombinase